MRSTNPVEAADFLKRIRSRRAGLESLDTGAAPDQPPVSNFDSLPDAHKSAVEGAAAKLARPETMTPHERFALEAIIIPDHRPAIAIKDADYQITHPDWLHLNAADIHARITLAIPAIGRLELPSRTDIPYGGTAFLVGPGLLMTNRHVAELFVDGAGRGLTFRPGASAAMNYVEEAERKVTDRFAVTSVVLVHPYWDMALLRVADAGLTPLTLDTDDPAQPDEDIVVIGYPAFNPGLDRAVQDQVFGGLYNVKRLQPGRRLARREVDSFGKTVNAATHDASTLGGNSGSAVISTKTGHVIALHFGGAYLDTNYAVPMRDLALDAQLQYAGLAFADPRPAVEDGPWSSWWRGLETVARPMPAPVTEPKQTTVTLAGETLTVTVTVELGKPSQPAEAPELERLAEPWHDSDYSDRRGYDPQFLGIDLPLPEGCDPSILARLADGSTVIPYTHFSLAMHAKRRLALFTASNVRNDRAAREPEQGGDYRRGALAGLQDGDTEKWFTDPRLRGIEQLPDRFFTKDRKAFDKGHLVRRDDVAWGETYAELRQANGDTYHVTNCSPQVADFNRPNGHENWGDLEKAVLKQATDQRLSVFAGPMLADDDPVFKGVDDKGGVSVRIPRAYWKVIAAPDGAGLGAYAFVLEQDLSGVAMEKVTFGAQWRRFMIPIKDLEDRLKLVRFPDAFHDADRFATSAGRALADIAKA